MSVSDEDIQKWMATSEFSPTTVFHIHGSDMALICRELLLRREECRWAREVIDAWTSGSDSSRIAYNRAREATDLNNDPNKGESK